jgi:sarcosine oxidase subunit gamma
VPDRHLIAQSALTRAPLLPAPGAGPAGVTITLPPMMALATVIARKGQAEPLTARVESAFGIRLPIGPRRAVGSGISFIGTAPGQWLAVGEAALLDGLVGSIGAFAAVIDQSDSRALIRVAGPKARAALAKGLPIDLHPRQFQVGCSAVTVMALFAVQLWQLDDSPAFDVLVSRSSTDDFLALLVANAAEYGLAFSDLSGALP